MISFLYSKDFSLALSSNKQFPHASWDGKPFGVEAESNLCILYSISVIE